MEELLNKKMFLLIGFSEEEEEKIADNFPYMLTYLIKDEFKDSTLEDLVKNEGKSKSDILKAGDLKVCIVCGIEDSKIHAQIKAVKNIFDKDDLDDFIFARVIKNNLKMKISELISHLKEDHEYIKNNPQN